MTVQLVVRRAGERDVTTLVDLFDGAARWMLDHGIEQWRPGERDAAHFRKRITAGEDEVWLAHRDGAVAGAYELWWSDEEAWGPQPPVAGYVHRLMTHRAAPPGTGRLLLADAERRIRDAGRALSRLDCESANPRLRAYYEGAGYAAVGEPRKKENGERKYSVIRLEKPLG
ncbi:N-acetyltransferase family protein [Actinomycetota bacterium Odt1-20B]